MKKYLLRERKKSISEIPSIKRGRDQLSQNQVQWMNSTGSHSSVWLAVLLLRMSMIVGTF